MTLLSLGSSERRRTGLAVAAVHAAVILWVCLPGLFQRQPPPLLHVKLAAAPPTPADDGLAASPPSPTPAMPPQVDDSAPGAPTVPPQPPAQNDWRPRSVDDIRDSAKLEPVQQSAAARPPRARPRSPDVSGLRETLRDQTRVDVTASPQLPQSSAWDANSYAAVVHTRLYALWRQPSGTPGQTARARLRVDRNGRILEARLLAADTQAMRRSIVKLLDSLTKLPAPSRYGLSNTTVTLPVVFRLEE